MTQEELAHTKFPLGEIADKSEVRELAEKADLANAEKPDSQDICFVPDGDYAKVIENYTGKSYPKGNYIDTDGNVLGEHKGIIHYTIGQRRGLGIALGKHMYVCDKNPENNTVTLGDISDLMRSEVNIGSFNWILYEKPPVSFKATAKLRYNQKQEYPCTVFVDESDNSKVKLILDEPQKAVAKGQAAVLYDGDYVIGGGTIL